MKRQKNVLIACEESQIVTIEMRKLNINAFSCDIKKCSGDKPQWHIQGDVINILKYKWDMIIAFPPCTHLANSGARWFEEKRKKGQQWKAINFFMQFVNCKCYKIAIENPVGIMSTIYKKPDQIIYPYQYGHTYSKRTCLWLKNLPKLKSTKTVNPGARKRYRNKIMSLWYVESFNISSYKRSEYRSKTPLGIAKAMALQWGIFA
jgi:hypothetical protein